MKPLYSGVAIRKPSWARIKSLSSLAPVGKPDAASLSSSNMGKFKSCNLSRVTTAPLDSAKSAAKNASRVLNDSARSEPENASNRVDIMKPRSCRSV